MANSSKPPPPPRKKKKTKMVNPSPKKTSTASRRNAKAAGQSCAIPSYSCTVHIESINMQQERSLTWTVTRLAWLAGQKRDGSEHHGNKSRARDMDTGAMESTDARSSADLSEESDGEAYL